MNPFVVNFLLLLAGVGVLYFGAEWLVRGAARMAASMGVSSIVIGLTVVSIGTSAPELVVAMVAALGGNSDLAIGNVMGSNLANIGLILGLTAIIRPMEVHSRVIQREVPIMLGMTILLFPLMMDGELGFGDGLILLATLATYLFFVNRTAGDDPDEVLQEYEGALASNAPKSKVRGKDITLIVAGSIGLVLGGTAIVRSAEFIAVAFGIPDMIIGLTIVAIGTSLPELATSLVAAFRREADIAVGNIIGSNIFNIGLILGATSIVTPITTIPQVVREELPAVLLLSLLVFPVTKSAMKVQRWEGAVLLTTYVVLGAWLFHL